MPIDIEKKVKKQFTLALIILVAVAGIIGSLHIVLLKMNENTQSLRNDLAEARGQDVATLRRAIRGYEENADVLNAALIEQDKSVLLIEDLQRLSTRANLESTIQSIELFDITRTDERVAAAPGKITAERAYGELHVNMVTKGSWSSAMLFLSYLENIPQRIVIKDMRMSLAQREEQQLEWTTVFQLVVTTL